MSSVYFYAYGLWAVVSFAESLFVFSKANRSFIFWIRILFLNIGLQALFCFVAREEIFASFSMPLIAAINIPWTSYILLKILRSSSLEHLRAYLRAQIQVSLFQILLFIYCFEQVIPSDISGERKFITVFMLLLSAALFVPLKELFAKPLRSTEC